MQKRIGNAKAVVLPNQKGLRDVEDADNPGLVLVLRARVCACPWVRKQTEFSYSMICKGQFVLILEN